MTEIVESIPIEGADNFQATLKYTRHGPVVFEDSNRNLAYAVRAAWMEIGGAPYLAALRMDQAKSWEEFRLACTFSNIPGENMIWADRTGTIGWQSVGIAPLRRNWSGLVPVPGDGRYEWDGYLPIISKPNIVNPAEGFFATANNDLVARDYPHMDAIGYSWTDPYRHGTISTRIPRNSRRSGNPPRLRWSGWLSWPCCRGDCFLFRRWSSRLTPMWRRRGCSAAISLSIF